MTLLSTFMNVTISLHISKVGWLVGRLVGWCIFSTNNFISCHVHFKAFKTDVDVHWGCLHPGLLKLLWRFGVISINEVSLHWARLAVGWVTAFGQVNHLAMQPATQANSAWPSLPRRGMHTGDGYEFCVAVGPATRTAGVLTQLVKGAGLKLSQPSSRSESCHELA